MSEPGRSPTGSGRRRLELLCVVLVAAALALWGSSRLTWFTATVPTPSRGAVPVAATGAEVLPALGGVAVLALAAVAATVAVSGIARRVLGAVVALAAVATGAAVTGVLSGPPPVGELADAAGVAVGVTGPVPVDGTPASWLGLSGTVLLLAAGMTLLVAERGLPRLGRRYSAPGAGSSVADPDRAVWNELDAGRDPTDVAGGSGVDTGGEPPAGRV